MADFASPFPLTAAPPPTTIVRTIPSGAVHAGASVTAMVVSAGACTAPCHGTVRIVGTGDARLIELTPFALARSAPGTLPATLAASRLGVPIFYLKPLGAPAPATDALVMKGAALDDGGAGDRELVVCFQDGVTLPPSLWLAEVAALVPASDPDAGGWALLRAAFAAPGLRVHVRDHRGAPLAGRPIELLGPTGTATTVTVPADGVLLLDPGAGRPAQLRLPGAEARPAYAVYAEDGAAGGPAVPRSLATPAAATAPAARLDLPGGARELVVLATDLAAWFPPPAPAPPPDPRLPGLRGLSGYHLGCRVEPLIDGQPTLARITADLRAAAVPGGAAHLVGYTLADFPLIPGDASTTIVALTRALRAAGGDARFLIWKHAGLTDAQWLALRDMIATAGPLLGFGVAGASLGLATAIDRSRSMWGTAAALSIGFGLAALLAAAVGLPASAVQEIFETALGFEPPRATRDALNALLPAPTAPPLAISAIHPSVFADNPLAAAPLVAAIDDLLGGLGAWHQKLQAFRIPAPGGGAPSDIAYVGGIDLHTLRNDTAGHHGRPLVDEDDGFFPMHDVHARLLGPVVADALQTIDDRFGLEAIAAAAATPPRPPVTRAITGPFPPTPPLPDGPHIAQLARTYHRPAALGALPIAPSGERTIFDGLRRAIAAAREYIYIEDQYFSPAGEPGAFFGDTYLGALVAAASSPAPSKRLIILGPNVNDQPFGAQRRAHVHAQLRAAWGDRLILGTPVRRPVLPAAGATAHEGRCRLHASCTADADTIEVAPRGRVRGTPPFWLWVGPELMLCTSRHAESEARVELRVHRADPAWRTSRAAHTAGEPVTFAQLKGIYVHSKIMIVDDVYCAIGSANVNRRGHFHDGEVAVFAVPQALVAAADNPARALRTALWAEHLGLPPAIGAPLLRDPRAAYPLFDPEQRTHWTGNRFADVALFDEYAGRFGAQTAAALIALVTGTGTASLGPIWDTLVDPTSHNDPQPLAGPTP